MPRVEATEEVIWTKWMLSDVPSDRLLRHFDELTLLFSHSKGERVFRDDAAATIAELHNRGYKLAVITNTVSRTLVPAELREAGVWDYMSAHTMSSVTGIRKPDIVVSKLSDLLELFPACPDNGS